MGFRGMRHCERRILAFFISVLTLVDITSFVIAREDTQPNILLILADDVGSEVPQCYGGESYATPRIDQLAQEGMRFEHAYAMAVCHPTRICLLSGQYPFRMGNPKWGSYPESAEANTIAQVLKNAGYATAVAGKWQIGMLGEDLSQPNRLGFDEYCLFGWHEGPRYYQPLIWQNGKNREDVKEKYGPDVYCDFLIDFIQRHREKPFFAYYPMALCHAVTNDLDKPVPVGPNGRYQTFGEMVEAMDERVGRMVDAVDQAGLRDNTLVVFLTDNGSPAKNIDGVRNGELIYTPVSSIRNGTVIPGGKAQLTDAGTRVPMIVRWPGKIPADSKCDDLIDVSDFLPTLAEVAGGELPSGITLDGRSFANRLEGEGSGPREWVFAEHKENAFVKDRRWKLFSDGRLYDVQEDSNEQSPLKIGDVPHADSRAASQLNEAIHELFAAGLPRRDSQLQE
ncbi:sulfatase-like hydrolase/transferase [Bythopirellula polymerisocia]|uniref:Arylsulfatase n=1 Tax=Bythopirellula polymerisocia TaxID=2528003 RepID=A0A5C6CW16_9BACT|nr:sulfatase-like hydrolase/transferase [Bythopirellula polymerisocia]TWU27894.1 Arylsulfatase [Bythopirellula polymerisocia]